MPAPMSASAQAHDAAMRAAVAHVIRAGHEEAARAPEKVAALVAAVGRRVAVALPMALEIARADSEAGRYEFAWASVLAAMRAAGTRAARDVFPDAPAVQP